MTYDHWKATNPEDEFLGPDPDDDGSYPPPCTNKSGHEFVCRDDDEEISYCQWCGADGNA